MTVLTISLLLASPLALAAPTLSVTGTCPGEMDISVDVGDGEYFALVWGWEGESDSTVGLWPCGSPLTGLETVGGVKYFPAPGGSRTLSPVVPDAVCGMHAQVFDLMTCEASPVVPLDGSGGGGGGGGECDHMTIDHEAEGETGQWCDGDALLYYKNYGSMTFDECQCIANQTGTQWYGGEWTDFPAVWVGDQDADLAVAVEGAAYWTDVGEVARDSSFECVLAKFDHRSEPDEFPAEETHVDAQGRTWHFWQYSAQTHSQVIAAADDVGGRIINPNSVGLDGVTAFTQPTHWCHAGAQFNGTGTCNSDESCNFVMGYFEDAAPPPTYVGGFTVNSGPDWGDDGPPYSCLQACAENFGGDEGDYQCSTSDLEIDNLGYYDGWGDATYCTIAQPEDFVVGDHTSCDEAGCYYSAWVSDHGCDSTNHCWTR